VEKRINALETELKEKTEQLDCKTKKINEQQECLKNLQERLNHDDLDTCRQIDAYSLRLCNIFQINGNFLSLFTCLKNKMLNSYVFIQIVWTHHQQTS